MHTTHTTNNDKILTERQSHTFTNNEIILTEGHSNTTTTPQPTAKVLWQKSIYHQRDAFDKRSLIHVNNNETFFTKVQSHTTTTTTSEIIMYV